jgi:hypothetical protein
MVYKKYVNGNGPYYYKSKKVNGKVITKYLGTDRSAIPELNEKTLKINSKGKHVSLVAFFSLTLLVLALLIFLLVPKASIFNLSSSVEEKEQGPINNLAYFLGALGDLIREDVRLSPLEIDPILHLTFDDDLSDEIATDSSANTIDGTCTLGDTCPFYNSSGGYDGLGAYEFDGIRNQIRLPSDVLFGLESKTVTFWARVNSYRNYLMVYETSDGAYTGFRADTDLRINWLNSSGAMPANDFNYAGVPVGEWGFYSVIYNISGADVNISVYRNAQFIESSVNTNGFIENPITSIGARNAVNNVFNGSIDDFRVYDKVLNQSELEVLYTWIPSQECNNNIIEGTETCDGTSLNSQTCISQGFVSGDLGCLNDCTGFDVSSCVAPV